MKKPRLPRVLILLTCLTFFFVLIIMEMRGWATGFLAGVMTALLINEIVYVVRGIDLSKNYQD